MIEKKYNLSSNKINNYCIIKKIMNIKVYLLYYKFTRLQDLIILLKIGKIMYNLYPLN